MERRDAIDLVTVIFGGEIDLLRLQAASIALRSGRSNPAEAALASVENGSAEVLAVHRARIPALTPSERTRLEAIWRERGLPSL